MEKNVVIHFKIILSILCFATFTRIAIPPFIGHPPNFSPIDAIALFCGAYFGRSFLSFGTVLISVWIGDIILNKIALGYYQLFYPGCMWQYESYILIIFFSSYFLKEKRDALRLMTASFASALLFFILSNFGVWWSGLLYSHTLNGLLTCYVNAIPFFKNTLFSDLFFVAVIFGVLRWVPTRFLHWKNN